MKQITINSDNANRRIDKFLLKYLNRAPKSFIYKMLRKKNIILNGKKALGNELLKNGDIVTIYFSDETLDKFMEEHIIKETKGSISIIYEDKNILLCNKPAGILSHPGNVSDDDTIIDRILFYLNETGGLDLSKSSAFLPALCGRLDRNTSGIVICGKNILALQSINKALAERKIDKYYTALAQGNLDSGVLTGWLSKNNNTNSVKISEIEIENSREANTEYKALKKYKNCTLLEIKLITGRPHQIRAHLQSIGHPLVGDKKYGYNGNVSGQLLHCSKIVFNEAIQNFEYLKDREFIAPLPLKFKAHLQGLL